MQPISQILIRQLVENSPDAILVKTATRIVYANHAALTHFGASRPADLLGRPPLDLIAPEDRAEVLGYLNALFAGRAAVIRMEKPMVRLDGSSVDVKIAAAPLVFDGQPAIQAVVRDVTTRRRTALAQARLAAIVESSQDASSASRPTALSSAGTRARSGSTAIRCMRSSAIRWPGCSPRIRSRRPIGGCGAS